MEGDRVPFAEAVLRPCTFYKKERDGRVRCTGCRHYCSIADKKAGICMIRKNRGGVLYGIWGYVSYVRADPVERKPLFHFHPGTAVYSIGTVGCNFRCEFCQNHAMAQSVDKYPLTRMAPLQVIRMARRARAQGIAFTFNEPSITPEFVLDTFTLAKKKGFYTTLVTNGYLSDEALESIAPVTDSAVVGIKTYDADRMRRQCSASLSAQSDGLRALLGTGVHVEISFLVRDGDDSFEDFLDFYGTLGAQIPLHLTKFYPEYHSHEPQTSDAMLERCYDMAKARGIDYVYVSNPFGKSHEHTVCPGCGTVLVERNASMGEPSVSEHCTIYQVVEDRLEGAATCPVCGNGIPMVR